MSRWRIASLFVLLGGLTVLPAVPAAAAPANDAFVDAIEIGALPFAYRGSSTGATTEEGEPTRPCDRSSAASVWFRYTAQQETGLSLSTEYSSYTPNIGIYSGTSLADLRLIDCGYASTNATIRAGTTVWIQIAGAAWIAGLDAGASTGALGLDIWEAEYPRPAVPLPNDDIADATSISSLPFHDTQMLGPATQEADEPTDCIATSDSTAWYRYDAAYTVTLRAYEHMIFSSGYLAAYRDTEEGLDLIGCADEDLDWGDDWAMNLRANAGETILFQLSGDRSYGYDYTSSFWLYEMPPADVSVRDVRVLPNPGITPNAYRIELEVGVSGLQAAYFDWSIELCAIGIAGELVGCRPFRSDRSDLAADDRGVRVLTTDWTPTACVGRVQVVGHVEAVSVTDLVAENDVGSRTIRVGPDVAGADTGICEALWARI